MSAIFVLLAASQPALAACPVELAVYGEVGGEAEVDFTPGSGNALVTNGFRMLLGNDVVLDGFVIWTEEAARPWGTLTYRCPEGDVTGDEIAACTVWEGVVYAAGATGDIALLPREGADAPKSLIFAGLGPALRHSPAYDASAWTRVPFDVFALKGCQE